MTRYALTFSAFTEASGFKAPARTLDNPLVATDGHAEEARQRYTNAGATDATLTPISEQTFQAIKTARLAGAQASCRA